MKVTRFINGSKIEKPLNQEIKVKNEIVQNTIEKVNKRILNSINFENNLGEVTIYE